MNSAPKPCQRGCLQRNQHLPDCENQSCTGCEPRLAEHGLMCKPCTQRLTEWLSNDTPEPDWWTQPPRQRREITASLLWAVQAVTIAAKDGIHGVAYDQDRIITGELAAPVNLGRLILLKDIDETIQSWLNYWTTERGLRGIDQYDLAYACRYLTSWLDDILNWEPVADMWEELADLMIRAHMIAPWRRERRTCPAPCPSCGTKTLVIYGGDDFVTCTGCGSQTHRDEYERWAKQVADEARPKPLSYWAHYYGQPLRAMQKQAQRIGLEHDAIGRSGAKLYTETTVAKITKKDPKCGNVAPVAMCAPKSDRVQWRGEITQLGLVLRVPSNPGGMVS